MGSVRHLLALPTQPHFRPQINWRSLKRLKVEVCPFHPPNPPSPTLFACSGFALRKQEGFQTIEPSDSPSTSDGRIPYDLSNQNGKKFLVEFNISLEWSKERESTAWVKISLLSINFLLFICSSPIKFNAVLTWVMTDGRLLINVPKHYCS